MSPRAIRFSVPGCRNVSGKERTQESALSGGETIIIAAIVAAFLFFMIVVAWADAYTRDSRGSWNKD
jgi:hypothetical protein